MKPRSVDILGGGPAGLFAARLIRRRFPDSSVVVHERRALGSTFGFGVGLAAGTQRNIASADPEVGEVLRSASHAGSGSRLNVPHGVGSIPSDGVVAIERRTLLRGLSRLARDVGVEIRYGHHRELSDLTAELVIAADGVGSAVRRELGEELGVTTDVGRGLYLWCGADFALDLTTFEPVTTQHGTFTVHAYPYADDKSTFLVETDERTWRNAGFDVTTQQLLDHESDQVALDYLSDAFAATLGHRRLIGNRTRWSRFRTVSCDRWFHNNVVLIGDAAHTAHYSIGSGTKLAMEDAIALVDEIDRSTTLEQAFLAYDQQRRPRVESLQEAARRSQAWWDSFPDRSELPVDTLLVSFLTRTGRLDLDRVNAIEPRVVRAALRHYAGAAPASHSGPGLTDWVLGRPFCRGELRTSRRLIDRHDLDGHRVTRLQFDLDSARTTEADTVLAQLAGPPTAVEVVCLCGPNAEQAAMARIDFAERVKRAHPQLVVAVEAAAGHDAALAAALVADRIDLVDRSAAEPVDAEPSSAARHPTDTTGVLGR